MNARPDVSIWFVMYVLFAFLGLTFISIHQDNVIQEQKKLIRQMQEETCSTGGNRA